MDTTLDQRPGLIGPAGPFHRIVTIDAGPLLALEALRARDHVVAVNAFADGPVAPEPAPRASRLAQRFPSRRDVLALSPDLVVAGDNEAFEVGALGDRDELAALGVATFLMAEAALEGAIDPPPATLETTWEDLLSLGAAVGRAAVAEALVARQRRETPPPHRSGSLEPVLVLDAWVDGGLLTAGRAAIVSDLLRRAGCRNVFADQPFTYGVVPIDEVRARRAGAVLISDYGTDEVTAKLSTYAATIGSAPERVVVLPLHSTVEGPGNAAAVADLARLAEI